MSITTVPLRPIKKGSLTKFWIGIAAVVLVAGAAAYVGTADTVISGASNSQYLAANASNEGVVQTESGLQYQVLLGGEGPSPQATDTALVKYKGSLRDGTVFDSSEKAPGGQVPMPVNGVVPGFSEALQLMQKGGSYRVWLPSALAYGEASPGPDIPANSLLIFEIELVDFITQEQMNAIRAQQMQQQGGPLPRR